MPATILPFERLRPSDRAREFPASIRETRPAVQRVTSRQIAHRWAMLSHLRRHVRPKDRQREAGEAVEPPDPVR
jgi:hypothetical protein